MSERLYVGIDLGTFVSDKEFMSIFEQDIRSAKRSVVIYSGFTSANQVRRLLNLFQEMISRGIKFRVVAKWQKEDWFFTKDGVPALKLLQEIGVVVDLRADIHQKAILIDNDVFWIGSLNPLSFGGKTEETMVRYEGGIMEPLAFAKSVALRGEYSVRSISDLVRAENPKCGSCKSLTEYHRFKGKKFVCVSCGMSVPFGRRR